MKVRAIVLSALALIVLLPFHNCAPAGDSGDQPSVLSFDYSPISLSIVAGQDSQVEEGQSVDMEVTIQNPQPVDLRLEINLTQSGLDLQLPVSEITLPKNAKSVKFTVQALSDATIESDETGVVQVMYKDAPAPTGTGPLTLTVKDKSPVPALTMGGLMIQEGATADLTINAAYAIPKDITFDLQVINGTASSADYQIAAVSSLKIAKGTTQLKIPVKALADALIEPNESFTVKIVNPVFATASATGTPITISDNTVLPALTVAAAAAAEGTMMTFNVSLSATSKYNTTFKFTTEDGTAKDGVNFDDISGTLTIPAGQKLALISVKGRNDGLHNANLNFKLNITNISGATNTSASAMGTFVESLKCDSKNLIKLASAFGTGMVLHEDKPRIWGTARANSMVQLSLKGRAGSTVVVKADANGKFMATIPLNNIASGATEIQIKNLCEEDKVPGVLIGEVFLCSGQSNMDFSVASSTSKAEVAAEAATASVKDNIRLFQVNRAKSATVLTSFPAVSKYNVWVQANPTTTAQFSAVCYHFGREIQKKLQKPIGLIHSSFGGTKIEEWVRKGDMPAKYLHPTASLNSGAYNAMIAPLVPMKISGVAWYQGESNADRASLYKSQLKNFVASWRGLFLNTVLDFHIVGLAGVGAYETAAPGSAVPAIGPFAHLREAQLEFLAIDAHASYANAIGTSAAGDLNNIHPKDKKTVGQRLARAALTQSFSYPETMPQWNIANTTEATKIVNVQLTFPLGMGLPAVGTEFKGFQVKAGTSNKYSSAAKVASINTATGVVIIAVAAPANPTEIRFQMHQQPKISYKTPVNADPLFPLCMKKNGTKWEICADSYQ